MEQHTIDGIFAAKWTWLLKLAIQVFFHMRIWIRIMSMMRMQPNTSKIEKSYYSDKYASEYSKCLANIANICHMFGEYGEYLS